MTVVGVTGHRELPAAAEPVVVAAIEDLLGSTPSPLVGLSSLAIGADQLFARALLAASGELVVVRPCAELESTFAPQELGAYRHLLGLATRCVDLPFGPATEEAFLAAGTYIAEHSDVLVAVWDGRPARGVGGTADVVAHRRALGWPVVVVWPDGAVRD